MSKKVIIVSLISLLIVGVFAMPITASASWTDILGGFGIGGSSQNYNNQNSYDYNSTKANSSGDIKMSKEVRQIGNSKYQDRIKVRAGAAVEVWIEVKNTSSKYSADTIIRDEIGGSSVYVKNSLRVNGQTSQPGLTSTGLRFNIPSKGKVVITYQMNVCNSTNYPMRAYASAPGIGASTDAIIIQTETFNVGHYDNTSTCLSQFQTSSNTSGNPGNPFGEWTGVNSNSNSTTNNPFSGWTGVNNSNSTSTSNSNNPFGEWAGVPSGSTQNTDPFGTWTGVQSSTSGNPFGDWTGVPSGSSQNNDPFGTWTGVQSSGSGNPFGHWSGVDSLNNSNNFNNSDSQYDMSGYSTNRPTASYANSTDYAQETQTQTNFVAPTTGVSTAAPFVFSSILTAGFVAFRNRKLIFN